MYWFSKLEDESDDEQAKEPASKHMGYYAELDRIKQEYAYSFAPY